MVIVGDEQRGEAIIVIGDFGESDPRASQRGEGQEGAWDVRVLSTGLVHNDMVASRGSQHFRVRRVLVNPVVTGEGEKTETSSHELSMVDIRRV